MEGNTFQVLTFLQINYNFCTGHSFYFSDLNPIILGLLLCLKLKTLTFDWLYKMVSIYPGFQLRQFLQARNSTEIDLYTWMDIWKWKSNVRLKPVLDDIDTWCERRMRSCQKKTDMTKVWNESNIRLTIHYFLVIFLLLASEKW